MASYVNLEIFVTIKFPTCISRNLTMRKAVSDAIDFELTTFNKDYYQEWSCDDKNS